jgi:hypothetical protein
MKKINLDSLPPSGRDVKESRPDIRAAYHPASDGR